MMRSAFDMVSACASVLATTKSTPCSPAVIMLLTALPPAPPTPNTVMRGFNSRMSGIFKLMLMGASCWGGPCRRLSPVRHRRSGCWDQWFVASETLAQPASDAGDVAAARRPLLTRRVSGFEMFEMRRLRVDQEPGRGSKGRPFGNVRHPGDAQRTAKRDWTPKHTGSEVGEAGQQTAAPGENDAATRFR